MITSLYMFCSMDSLIAAMAFALLGCPKPQQRTMISAFVVCDGMATLAGLALGAGPSKMLPALLFQISSAAVWASILLGGALLIRTRGRTRLALAVPLLLSLDNLFSCAFDPKSHSLVIIAATAAGLTSGLFAWAGFRLATEVEAFVLRASRLATQLRSRSPQVL
jgi:hypothetical protein